jgi:hypothetical protein
MSLDNFKSYFSYIQTSDAWAVEQSIDKALGEYIKDPLVWAIRPYLGLRINQLLLNGRGKSSQIKEQVLASAKLHFPLLNLFRDTYLSKSLEGYSVSNKVMRFWVTRNQRVALGMDLRGQVIPKSKTSVRVDPKLCTDVQTALRTQFPKEIIAFVAPLLNDAARFRDTAARLVDLKIPKVLVVASNESVKTRLMVYETRSRGIPSVYIPHAPTALARRYADIITDVALLRGEGDFDYYSMLGAKTSGLIVTGDPTFNLPHSGIASTGKIVICCTVSAAKNEQLFQKLARHPLCKSGGVVAIPHPASQKMRVSYFEKKFGIIFSSIRTSEYLANNGAAVVISPTSSGALLEALSMGVPVIAAGGHPQYAFECRLEVHRPSKNTDLVTTVNEVIQTDSSLKRKMRKQAAVDWIGESGKIARMEINNIINSDIQPSMAILNSWGHTK